jgi:hypothetical protein
MPTVEIDYPGSGSTNIPRRFIANGTYADTNGALTIQCTLRDLNGQTVTTATANIVPDKGDSGTWSAAFSVDQDYANASLTAVLSNPPNDDASHQTTGLTIQGDPTIIVIGPLPPPRRVDEKDQRGVWPVGKELKVEGQVCAGVGVIVTLYAYRRENDSADGLLLRIGPAKTTMAEANGHWAVSFKWETAEEKEFLEELVGEKCKLAIIAAAIGRNGKNLGRVVWRPRSVG